MALGAESVSVKILVVMSVWNGERHVHAQIKSILEQNSGNDISILVRDDGSSDSTASIIDSFSDSRIQVLRGNNIGAKRSFLDLLSQAAGSDADLVAFADQDDIWLPGKLQRAAERLAPINDGPALYCSALNLVNESLQPIRKYVFPDETGFESAFLVNAATGCTVVINRRLLELLAEVPAVDEILMHDWWAYLVAVSFGRVVYDDRSLILYRQHASNQVGMRTGLAGYLHRTRLFFRRAASPSRLTQAREFLRLYGGRLLPARRRYLESLTSCEHNVLQRIRFLATERPRRHNFLENMAAVIAFLFGRY